MQRQVRQFKAEDAISFFDPNEPNLDVKSQMEWAVRNETLGPAFTGVKDGKIIGCGGVRIIWPGVGDAWALFHSDCNKDKFFIFRHCKRHLDKIIKDNNLHRVQSTPLCEWGCGISFAKHME